MTDEGALCACALTKAKVAEPMICNGCETHGQVHSRCRSRRNTSATVPSKTTPTAHSREARKLTLTRPSMETRQCRVAKSSIWCSSWRVVRSQGADRLRSATALLVSEGQQLGGEGTKSDGTVEAKRGEGWSSRSVGAGQRSGVARRRRRRMRRSGGGSEVSQDVGSRRDSIGDLGVDHSSLVGSGLVREAGRASSEDWEERERVRARRASVERDWLLLHTGAAGRGDRAGGWRQGRRGSGRSRQGRQLECRTRCMSATLQTAVPGS